MTEVEDNLKDWTFPNRATPPGSAAYYAVRVSRAEQRDDLAALYGWRHEIRAVLQDVSDPGVARLKLQWWREELQRSAEGKANHPLAKTLQEPIRRKGLPLAPLLQITESTEWEIRHPQPGSVEELEKSLEQDLGALFELFGRYQGIHDQSLLQQLRDIGRQCSAIYLLRDYGATIRAQRQPLPTGMDNKDNLARLGESWKLPPISRELPACVKAHAAILSGLLDELSRSEFEIENQRIRLTPLRKLWIAWRAT